MKPERLESLKLGCVEHVAALLRRRASCAPPRSGRRRPHARARDRGDRRAIRPRALAARRSRRRARRWRSPRSSRERLVGGRHHAGGPRPAAQADDRRRALSRLRLEGRQAGARAGARRRLRDHGGRDGGASRRAHQSRRRRAAARRPLRPARPHGQARQPRRDRRAFLERYRIDRAHAKRVAAMAKALYLAASPAPGSGSRAARGMGGLLHEIGFTRVAHRLSQARRVHPARTRTCRASRRRISATSRCSCSAAAAACRRWRRSSTTTTSRANPLAAARRAVPSRAARDRPAAHRARGRPRHPLRDPQAVAEGPSA